MIKYYIVIILLLFLSTITLSALDNFNDAVYLKNGTIIWGNIIENIPGDHIKIQTRSGSVFTFTFNEIDKITLNNTIETSDTTISKSTGINPVRQYQAEEFKDKYVMPQFDYRFSGYIGMFTIAADDFDKIYGNKSSLCYGGDIELRIDKQLNIIGKFSYMTAKSKPINKTRDEITITNAISKWDEYWILMGCKIYMNTNSQFIPYIGGGMGYFSATEGVTTILTIEDVGDTVENVNFSVSKNKWGFGLLGGLSIHIAENIFLFGEIDYTSALIKESNSEIKNIYFRRKDFSSDTRVLGRNKKIGGMSIGGGIQFGF